MYSNDTFFHLTVHGQIGLAVLSLVLACVTLIGFRKISSRFGLFVKVLLAIVFLWAFIWLSPQVYYLYYRLIIDGLPLQIVVGIPPGITEMFKTITFTAGTNLSAHSKGVLFWLMILVAAWKTPQPKRP